MTPASVLDKFRWLTADKQPSEEKTFKTNIKIHKYEIPKQIWQNCHENTYTVTHVNKQNKRNGIDMNGKNSTGTRSIINLIYNFI